MLQTFTVAVRTWSVWRRSALQVTGVCVQSALEKKNTSFRTSRPKVRAVPVRVGPVVTTVAVAPPLSSFEPSQPAVRAATIARATKVLGCDGNFVGGVCRFFDAWAQ